MCGVYGYLDNTGESLTAAVLDRMAAELNHRGPDDKGRFAADGVALGNCRLSIIDIAGGHQPFVSDDGNIAVVQNGEIYNFIELAAFLKTRNIECRTHSDTEVLLRLYELEGIEFVNRLNGMFAIAIWDGRQDTLHLIRDRLGVKPLYVHVSDNRLAFASEIKSILAGGVKPVLCPEALHHLLVFNYVPPPLTMFRGVTQVMPGERWTIKGGKLSRSTWWTLADQQSVPQQIADWSEEFLELLEDSVRLRLRADVDFGAFLSGGIDSSTIVGLMQRNLPAPVRTFSIGFSDPRFDESEFAAAAATRFGTRHEMQRIEADIVSLWPKVLWHCDQPHGDISFVPTYMVSALAAEHVKMVLTGDGGDELFAGYEKYLDFAGGPRKENQVIAWRRGYFDHISLFRGPELYELYSPYMKKLTKGLNSFEVADRIWLDVNDWDFVNQMLYLDVKLLLPGNNLVKPDRMGMAHSLEARTPFLDYRLVEFAFRTPGSMKIHEGDTKWCMKVAVRELIGNELTHRRKQMFTVPVGEWFKETLRQFVEFNLIENPGDLFTTLFDKDVVAHYVRQHVSGAANYTRQVRALLAVRLWIDQFQPEAE